MEFLDLEDLSTVPHQAGDPWSLTFVTNRLEALQESILSTFSDSDIEVTRLTEAQVQADLENNDILLGMAVDPGRATAYTIGGRFLAAGRSAYSALRGLLYAAAAAAIPIAAVSFSQKSGEVTENVNSTLDRGINILWLLLLIYLLYKWETR